MINNLSKEAIIFSDIYDTTICDNKSVKIFNEIDNILNNYYCDGDSEYENVDILYDRANTKDQIKLIGLAKKLIKYK